MRDRRWKETKKTTRTGSKVEALQPMTSDGGSRNKDQQLGWRRGSSGSSSREDGATRLNSGDVARSELG
ncbi:hypothetical protein PIB30_078347 [Stylosanthes scabra]|uniref:Uncharacterized protein n=1 Tax=Stylosanthes scabra TaxID=79078 RepID=A0ABU6YPR6_9FABA|nr:hypothetical protein [Stylosanthes scabra]